VNEERRMRINLNQDILHSLWLVSPKIKMKNLKDYFDSLKNKEVVIHIVGDKPPLAGSGVVRRAGSDYVELEEQSNTRRVKCIYPYNAIRYIEILY